LPFIVWIATNPNDLSQPIRVWVHPDIGSVPAKRICLAISPNVRVLSGDLDVSDVESVRRFVEANRSTIQQYWNGEVHSIDGIQPLR
jgi:hypothetical protein